MGISSLTVQELRREMEVCASCGETISDLFLYKVGQVSLHQHCLSCCVCSQPLSSCCYSKFGQFYCKNHFYDKFGPKCGACHVSFSPNDKIRNIGDNQFHVNCFSCTKCGVVLDKGMNVGMDQMGNILCEKDFIVENEE